VKRRTLLAAAAAATSAAGCLRDSSGSDTDGADTPTPTPTSKPSGGRRLVDRSFEVRRVECGDDYGGHEVTTDGGTVTVEGTLDGSDTCYTAELVRGEYVAEKDTLYVEVESVVDSEENETCAECIVEIDYEATFEFEGGTPESVRVDQRGQTSGSSSASESVSEGESDTPTATEFPGTPTPD
jgi:hypothetical protein